MENGDIVQVQDYYAFGLEMNPGNGFTPTPDNRYKYNGKEKQDETGQYHYGARFYDPVIGRWTSIDPMAEKYLQISAYTYVANNPLKYIDPSGKVIEPVGTAKQIKQINSALALIAKTNPEQYRALNEAKEVFTVSMAELTKRPPPNLSTGSASTLNFGGTEAREDQLGKFTTNWSPHDNIAYDGKTYTRDGPRGPSDVREEITETEANNQVFMNDNSILLDKSLTGKQLAKILAHEFGHAAYALLNKAKAYLRGEDDKQGHSTGNPTGEAAMAAEAQFEKNYDEAKKQLEDDKKKKDQ